MIELGVLMRFLYKDPIECNDPIDTTVVIENFLIFGDFINEENDHEIRNFLDAYGLKNLVKAATCFKSDTNRH